MTTDQNGPFPLGLTKIYVLEVNQLLTEKKFSLSWTSNKHLSLDNTVIYVYGCFEQRLFYYNVAWIAP